MAAIENVLEKKSLIPSVHPSNIDDGEKIDKIMEKLSVLKENLNNKKKQYERGIMVPSIHSQILPIIIDI